MASDDLRDEEARQAERARRHFQRHRKAALAGLHLPSERELLAGMAFLANGNTTTRGPYAENVERVVRYLVSQSRSNGLIASGGQESGRPHAWSNTWLIIRCCRASAAPSSPPT